MSKHTRDANNIEMLDISDLINAYVCLININSVTRNYFENLVRALENGLSDVDSQGACSKSMSSKNAAGSSKGKGGGRGKGSSRVGGSSKTTDDSGGWACDQCTYINSKSALACQMCHHRR